MPTRQHRSSERLLKLENAWYRLNLAQKHHLYFIVIWYELLNLFEYLMITAKNRLFRKQIERLIIRLFPAHWL